MITIKYATEEQYKIISTKILSNLSKNLDVHVLTNHEK